MIKRRKRFFYLLSFVFACLLIYLFIYLHPEYWNHNSEYKWRILWHGKRSAFLWVVLVWLALVSIIYWLGSWILKAGFRYKSELILVLAFILGILSPLVFSEINRFGRYELLVKVFVADHTSYFTDAQRFKDKTELIRVFREDIAKLSTHTRTHPVAVVEFFRAINQWAERSELAQKVWKRLISPEVISQLEVHFKIPAKKQAGAFFIALMILVCGALVLVFSWLVLRRFYSEELCWLAVCVGASTPMFSLKAPVADQLFALFIIFSVYLFLLKKWFYVRAFAVGMIIGAGVWLSPSVWVSVPLAYFLLFAQMAEDERKLAEILKEKKIYWSGFLMALGILIGLVLLSKLMGIGYIEMFKLNRAGWRLNNVASGRVHIWKWILFNPYEYLFWLSVPLMFGFAVKVIDEIKKGIKRKQADYFFIAWVGFLLLLDISGQVCYESPRLLWFGVVLTIGPCLLGTAYVLGMKNFHNLGWILILGLAGIQSGLFHLIY